MHFSFMFLIGPPDNNWAENTKKHDFFVSAKYDMKNPLLKPLVWGFGKIIFVSRVGGQSCLGLLRRSSLRMTKYCWTLHVTAPQA